MRQVEVSDPDVERVRVEILITTREARSARCMKASQAEDPEVIAWR